MEISIEKINEVVITINGSENEYKFEANVRLSKDSILSIESGSIMYGEPTIGTFNKYGKALNITFNAYDKSQRGEIWAIVEDFISKIESASFDDLFELTK